MFIQFNRWFARETRQGTSSSRGQAVGVMVNGKVDFFNCHWCDSGGLCQRSAKGLEGILYRSVIPDKLFVMPIQPIHLYPFHFAGSAPDGVEAAERKMEQSKVLLCLRLPPRLSFGESSAAGIYSILLLPARFCFGRRTRATRQGSSRETTLAAQVWPE